MTEQRATYTTERRRVRPMTARQAALLRFIIRYKAASGGDSPTIREMMRAVGITSTSITRYNLQRLEQRGYITLQGNAAARSIAVTGGRWVYEPTEVEP